MLSQSTAWHTGWTKILCNGVQHLQSDGPANQTARATLYSHAAAGCDWLRLKPKQMEPNSQADLESGWHMQANLACFFPWPTLALVSTFPIASDTHSLQQPPIPNLASESSSCALQKQRHPTEHESNARTTTAHYSHEMRSLLQPPVTLVTLFPCLLAHPHPLIACFPCGFIWMLSDLI